MQKDLEDAAKDMKGLSPDSLKLNDCGAPEFSLNVIPTKPYLHFVSINVFFYTRLTVNWNDLCFFLF